FDEALEAPIEDQPLPADALLTALSLGYIVDSDPEEDKEDPEEDPADHLADEGDNDCRFLIISFHFHTNRLVPSCFVIFDLESLSLSFVPISLNLYPCLSLTSLLPCDLMS
ncbi:hypothetical protein Tco_0411962, partial [Tanacetum coccineum]